jgi:hypothetical protein
LELRAARRAVCDARVFVDHVEGGEDPDLVLLDRSPEGRDVVLPGEGLLGIAHAPLGGARLRRILDRKASVQAGGALVKGRVSVPFIVAPLGRNDDGAGRRAARVRILLGRSHGKFLNRIGREILQEPADVVVGVVPAVDREFVVEPGAPTRGYRRDARLGGVGGLHRLGSGGQIGNVRKGPCGKGDGLEVRSGDRALVHGARQVEGLGRDGGRLALHVHVFPWGAGLEHHGQIADGGDGDRDLGLGIRKTWGGHRDAVRAGQKIIETKLAPGITRA